MHGGKLKERKKAIRTFFFFSFLILVSGELLVVQLVWMGLRATSLALVISELASDLELELREDVNEDIHSFILYLSFHSSLGTCFYSDLQFIITSTCSRMRRQQCWVHRFWWYKRQVVCTIIIIIFFLLLLLLSKNVSYFFASFFFGLNFLVW